MLSPLIAPLLRIERGRRHRRESLAVLAIASFGQIWSAALAATLAAARRFYASAACYVVASVTTLVVAVGLMLAVGVLGPRSACWRAPSCCSAATCCTCGGSASPPTPGPLLLASSSTWRLAGRAGASASWPLAQQLQLTIALAALATPVGAVTAYTYAFFVGAILYNITGATLGLVTLPSLVADLARQGRETAMTYLGITAPFGAFLYVPVAGAYAACGYPILDAVLGGSLSPETLTLLWDVSRTLLVMCFVWTVLTAVSNAALSLRLLRGLTVLSVVALVVQIVVQSLLSDPSGETVAIVHASVGSGMFVALLVVVFRERSLTALARVAATCWPVVPLRPGVRARRPRRPQRRRGVLRARPRVHRRLPRDRRADVAERRPSGLPAAAGAKVTATVHGSSMTERTPVTDTPSRFWTKLGAEHERLLAEHGVERVKRTQALRYFTWRWRPSQLKDARSSSSCCATRLPRPSGRR